MAGFFGGQRRVPNIDPQLGGLLAQEAKWAQAPMQQPQQQQPKKRGFLGKGGPGRAIAGTIGDVLLQRGGLAPIFAPQMELMQQAQAEEQQAERERQMRREDMQWEWANKPAPNNDTTNDLALIEQRLGPEQGNAYLQRLADPDVTVPLPNGQVYIGPRSGMAAALSGGGKPRNLGPVVDSIPGGPTPRASGNFRP